MTKLYLVTISCGVEAGLEGPFLNEEERDAAAGEFLIEDDDNTAHPLDIEDDGTPSISDYSGARGYELRDAAGDEDE